MAENLYNNKDSMDISELASLNSEDFSPEMIEQLQQKIAAEAQVLNGDKISPDFDVNDDTTLFEEPAPKAQNVIENSEQNGTAEQEKQQVVQKEVAKIDESIDDNFIKKYKAKLNKQLEASSQNNEPENNQESKVQEKNEKPEDNTPIEKLSEGKITEKIISKEQKEYNDSLDFLDGNVKYSKYVIYIDPQNVDFIEGLTVKERKNLINKILREQDDILITKKRFGKIQTIITHAIIAIVTLTVSIPIIYYTINASLEASIDNHRRAQTNFQTLYKERGKISNKN